MNTYFFTRYCQTLHCLGNNKLTNLFLLHQPHIRLIACSLRVETNAGAEDRVRNSLANVIGGATVANANFV